MQLEQFICVQNRAIMKQYEDFIMLNSIDKGDVCLYSIYPDEAVLSLASSTTGIFSAVIGISVAHLRILPITPARANKT